MKNKAFTTFIATAITATLVWPVPNARAASNEAAVNQSHVNDIKVEKGVAASILSGEKSLTITNVTSDTVRTSLGQFKISNALKPIFKVTNRQALMNADATVIVKNGEITRITSLTLKNAGTNKKAVLFNGGDANIAGDVTVDADYIKIVNLNIDNNFTVTNHVKKAITIDNVTIGDTLIFKPLATRKIEWLNVSLNDIETPNITVQRTKLNISADKIISSINVKDKVTSLEVMADVKKLVIDVEGDFSLYGEGKIEQVIVTKGASVALNSGHLVHKVQVDAKNAKVTLPKVTKDELNKLLASPPYVAVSINGNEILISDKWTTQAERTVFDSAVTSARTVANNTNASQEQVLIAITQYKNALASYQAVQKDGKRYSIGDKTTLTTLINSVQYVYVTVSNYGYGLAFNTPWTTQSEKDTLQSAVTSAQNVLYSPYSTETDITNAITNLENAILIYKNAYKYGTGYNSDYSSLLSLISYAQTMYVKVSNNNGNDVMRDLYWTDQNEYNSFTYAISYAQGIVGNYNSTQYDITNATNYLNDAINVYRKAYKSGNQN